MSHVLLGVHLSCIRQFDGYGGEIAHKYYRDVHFDNSEPYTVELSSGTSISLLLVRRIQIYCNFIIFVFLLYFWLRIQ